MRIREPASRSRFRWKLALIAVVALALRVGFVVVFTSRRDLNIDAIFYRQAALFIAHGDGYRSGWAIFDIGANPSAQFPPAVPLLLALPAALLGDARVWQHLAICIVGTATVVLVGLLGRRVGGETVGIVAAAIAAAHPMLIGADASLMAEGPYALLVVGCLLLTLRAMEQTTIARWLLVGAIVGLATMTRSEGLALLVFVVAPAVVLVRGVGVGRRLVLLGCAAIAVVAVIVPWTIRNARDLHHVVVLSNNSGTVLAGANCKQTYGGRDVGSWRYDCLNDVRTDLGASETEVSDALRSHGTRYMIDHWTQAPAVATVRAARTWGLWNPFEQMHGEANEGRFYGMQVLGWATTLILTALAIVAAWTGRHRDAVRLCFGTLVMVTITSMVTYGNQRFRIAAEPSIIVLASTTICALVRSRHNGTTTYAAATRG